MPTKRTRATRGKRESLEGLTPIERAYLLDEPHPEGKRFSFELLGLLGLVPRGRHGAALWEAHKADVLAEFIRKNPGRRPALWWEFDSPEPLRRRLGGTGDPVHGVPPRCGIPAEWEAPPWPGRQGGPWGTPPNPRDPPRFESQAAYLDRHGLLTPAERRKLTAADFEPEILTTGETAPRKEPEA